MSKPIKTAADAKAAGYQQLTDPVAIGSDEQKSIRGNLQGTDYVEIDGGLGCVTFWRHTSQLYQLHRDRFTEDGNPTRQ